MIADVNKFTCSRLQVMFENYQFEGVYIAIQAVLTLYAQGKMPFFLTLQAFKKDVALIKQVDCTCTCMLQV